MTPKWNKLIASLKTYKVRSWLKTNTSRLSSAQKYELSLTKHFILSKNSRGIVPTPTLNDNEFTTSHRYLAQKYIVI